MRPYTSKILKKLRSNQNKTQLEVAEFLGISRQAYSRYESSLREPDMETLSKIATYYNVSPHVFYIDDVDKPLEPDMDIVEMVARYQLTSSTPQPSDKETRSKLNYDFFKQDKDHLQSALSKHFDLDTKPKKHKPLRRKIVQYGFMILIGLILVNIGIMTLHRKDSAYQYNILKHSYINAITKDQNVNRTMYLDIIRINEFDPDNISVGDYVVIYSDFGLNEYFVEKVTQVNGDNQTISTTYDNETVTTNQFTDVIGEYEKEANFLGTVYYASKFNTGYLLLVLAQVIILAMYYLSFFDKQKDYNNY